MKLSKFVKRAKSESYCVVIHADDSGIWLGTRLALYNATELPYMEGKEQRRGMNPIRHSLLHDKKHCRLLPAACRKPPKLFRYGTGRKYRQAGARSSKCQLVSDKST